MKNVILKLKSRNLLRTVFAAISLSTALFIFQACYGTPRDLNDDFTIRGTVKSGKTNKPVHGIKVSIENEPQFTFTDTLGKFTIYTASLSEYHLKFEDLDSLLNGSYFQLDTIIPPASIHSDLNIFLHEK